MGRYVSHSRIYFALGDPNFYCGLDEFRDGHRHTCDFSSTDFMEVAAHTISHHAEQRRNLQALEDEYQDRQTNPEKYADGKPNLGTGQL